MLTDLNTEEGQVNTKSEDLKAYKQICDSLIKSLQTELTFYKDQYETLKEVTADSAKFKDKINYQAEPANNSNIANYKHLSDEIICNLRGQVRVLTEERDNLKLLWETTTKIVTNLETEIIEHRRYTKHPGNAIFQIRQEYDTVIKELQAKILVQNAELEKQKNANRTISDTCKITEQKFKLLEKKYQHTISEQSEHLEKIRQNESSLTIAKNQVAEIMRDKTDLEIRLNKSTVLVKKHMDRESDALLKIQEVLQVAEAAITDKNAALQREQEIREECDFLASTISQVLEEAASKVEKDMDDVKTKYLDKIKNLEITISKMKMSYENQVKKANTADERAISLEAKLKRLIQNNITLDTELQNASKAIIEMEMKLQTFEKLMFHEKEATKISDERNQDLQEFIENNKKLKERWKSTCEEIALQLKKEMSALEKQNGKLRQENQVLKLKLQSSITTQPFEIQSLKHQFITNLK